MGLLVPLEADAGAKAFRGMRATLCADVGLPMSMNALRARQWRGLCVYARLNEGG